MRTVSLPESSEARPDILIPARTLSELARILPADGPVEMLVTPQRSQVLFHTPTLDLVTRLIEGTFPNYRQIIPNDYTSRVVVETSALAQRRSLHETARTPFTSHSGLVKAPP